MHFPSCLLIEGHFLTVREAEVLLLSANGYTNHRIAQRLFISVKTVARHRDNIRTRFQLKGYHTLTQFAIKIRPELEKWVM